MIPENRPVLGMDVDELRKKLGLSVMDACWLFGLSLPKWGEVVNKAGNEPVPDECLALMVRYIDMNPDSCPIDPAIAPSRFYQSLQKYNERAKGKDRLPQELASDYLFFGALLGRDKSAGYRWIRQQGGTRPVIDHYIAVIDKDLRQGITNLNELRKMSLVELKARGRHEEAQALTYESGKKQ